MGPFRRGRAGGATGAPQRGAPSRCRRWPWPLAPWLRPSAAAEGPTKSARAGDGIPFSRGLMRRRLRGAGW
eukprot:942541-Lingulodinium_polyedra.AAC.1